MEIFSSCWLLMGNGGEEEGMLDGVKDGAPYITVKIRAKKENFAEGRACKAEHTQSERWIMS